jgi:Tripartite tricarboxylate transporter TctB family.
LQNKAGILGGFFVMLVSIVFFVYSLMYPYTSELGPGAGFLPLWLSGVLFILSLAYLRVAFKGEDSTEPMPDRKGWKNIFFILFCMAAFVALLPLLGFVVTGSIFLFVLLIGSYRWYVALPTAVGTSVFLFVLFSILLKVSLPVNTFGF